MKKKNLLFLFSLTSLTLASIGDNLPEFQNCLTDCDCQTIPQSIFWSCLANCNYFCQQHITNIREAQGDPTVQFYGKWPFIRVFGFQEFFSTIFSLMNLYVNYKNITPIFRQYRRNDNIYGYKTMYLQYLGLLIVSCVGWGFSAMFHFKDTKITETLDYFGAFAIVLSNLNVIVVRVFHLFAPSRSIILLFWHVLLIMFYITHVTMLKMDWDYGYNTTVNIIVGVSTMVLWCVHSWTVYGTYSKNYIVCNNSIQLLPHETKLLHKLTYLSMSAKSSLIPLIPILNNLILVCGIMLELNDFPPWGRLIDAHALWHLLTVYPSFIWFDWNIWDVEMMKIFNDGTKKKIELM
ncbi:PER1 Protein PER1 [Candida maltosa Xu316]|uniref:Post-GPI attachment to proteins factor 3 n=1 Tax=Candida maltosa (strain Xu316) TaxID=1245528 RepID=M3INN1_CANMX|nr:ER protein processing protein, putative [Candida maltosa Xu316]